MPVSYRDDFRTLFHLLDFGYCRGMWQIGDDAMEMHQVCYFLAFKPF